MNSASASKLAAVNDIKRLAQSLRGIMALADDLETVAGLEQKAEEAKSAHERIRKEHLASLAAFNNQVMEARTQADQYAAMRKSDVETMLYEAKATCNRLLEDARHEAKRIIEDSDVEATKQRDAVGQAQSLLAQLQAEHDALRVSCATLEAEHGRLVAQHQHAKEALSALKAKL